VPQRANFNRRRRSIRAELSKDSSISPRGSTSESLDALPQSADVAGDASRVGGRVSIEARFVYKLQSPCEFTRSRRMSVSGPSFYFSQPQHFLRLWGLKRFIAIAAARTSATRCRFIGIWYTDAHIRVPWRAFANRACCTSAFEGAAVMSDPLRSARCVESRPTNFRASPRGFLSASRQPPKFSIFE
jgi:hypothetical protein